MVFIVPILGFFFGIGLILTGAFLRPRRRLPVGIGALIVLTILSEGARIAYIDSGLDLNPILRDPRVLAGTWKHGSTVFVLSADQRWSCRTRGDEEPCAGRVLEGRWSSSDNLLSFASLAGDPVTELLVVRYRDTYRLIHNFGDPDDWDYTLDFERVSVEDNGESVNR